LMLGAANFRKNKKTRPKAKEMPQKGDHAKEGGLGRCLKTASRMCVQLF